LSLLAKAGKKLGTYLLDKALGVPSSAPSRTQPTHAGHLPGGDVSYNLAISSDQAVSGTRVQVELPHLEDGKTVAVTIPAGVKTGTRLRLKNLGEASLGSFGKRGDLYLELRVE
jgi:DnaJ-class molecular chaperone